VHFIERLVIFAAAVVTIWVGVVFLRETQIVTQCVNLCPVKSAAMNNTNGTEAVKEMGGIDA